MSNYSTLPSAAVLNTVVAGLKDRGVKGLIVENGAEALAKIKELIPAGASVMNGASVTLEQIGFKDYLKSGQHPWNNLHAAIVVEKDPAKQMQLRRQALLSDYYLGSVHALAETGEFVVASNTGSQLPHIVFTSPNLIFVVGAQKIVPTLADAMKRLEEYVVPLEDKHMQDLYGKNTVLAKIVTFKRESPITARNITLILVKEVLGF